MKFNRFAMAFLLSIYLVGIAYIAFLPPWEGYDEIAHYSYAQQIADTGSRPRLREGFISKDVERYMSVAPMPYSTVSPFNSNLGGITYRNWFGNDNCSRVLPHSTPDDVRFFSSGKISNWQDQHPPLYYRLIAPAVKLTAGLSWSSQLFVLRLVSWSLAYLGFVLSIGASMYAVKSSPVIVRQSVFTISILWAILFPEFYPEFARIGNDALVLLLMSFVWLMAVTRELYSRSWRWYFAMGLILGLGGLTKVTFLPISFAVFLWLIWLSLSDQRKRSRWFSLVGLVVTLSVFFAIAGDWYLTNLLERTSVTGLVELSYENKTGIRLLISALQHPVEIFRGLAGMVMTFVWGGSASSAYPPAVFVLPLLLPVFILLPSAYLGLRKFKVDVKVPFLALLVAGSVFGGLVYYLMARVAATSIGSGAPGWYLHVLIGPIGLLLGVGFAWFRSNGSRLRLLSTFSIFYALIFAVCITVLQLALFTGCTFKTEVSKIYSANDWSCVFDFSIIYGRLSLLAYPGIGVFCLFFAAIILSMTFLVCRKSLVGIND